MRKRMAGQAAVFMTLSLVPMLGVIGLVVDVGWAYWRREACRTAADAASTAAAVAANNSGTYTAQSDTACPATLDPSNPLEAGCLYAQQNGFTNGTDRHLVSVASGINSPPVGGTTPPAYWVTYTVSETIPTLFSAVLGNMGITVRAQSSAAVYDGPPDGCIFVLNQSLPSSWTQSGGNVHTSCGVYVDSQSSSDPQAVTMSGGNIHVDNGASMDVAGGISLSGGNIKVDSPGQLRTHQAQYGNPFSGLVSPTPSLPAQPAVSISSGQNTLNPGTYQSISISGGNTTMNPGIYIIMGSFNYSSGNTTANGVTLYFPSSAGNLNYSAGGFTLTAPSGGTTDGIAVWKDGPGSCNMSGGNLNITGAIYMPQTALYYSGGTSGNGGTETIVVDTITMSGGNIHKAAKSKYFSGGGGPNGVFIVQ